MNKKGFAELSILIGIIIVLGALGAAGIILYQKYNPTSPNPNSSMLLEISNSPVGQIFSANKEAEASLNELLKLNPGLKADGFTLSPSDPFLNYAKSNIPANKVAGPKNNQDLKWVFSPGGKRAFSDVACFGEDCTALDIFNYDGNGLAQRFKFCGTPCGNWKGFWLSNDKLAYIRAYEDDQNCVRKDQYTVDCGYVLEVSVFDFLKSSEDIYIQKSKDWPVWPPLSFEDRLKYFEICKEIYGQGDNADFCGRFSATTPGNYLSADLKDVIKYASVSENHYVKTTGTVVELDRNGGSILLTDGDNNFILLSMSRVDLAAYKGTLALLKIGDEIAVSGVASFTAPSDWQSTYWPELKEKLPDRIGMINFAGKIEFTGWKTFQSKLGGYHLQYPPDWASSSEKVDFGAGLGSKESVAISGPHNFQISVLSNTAPQGFEGGGDSELVLIEEASPIHVESKNDLYLFIAANDKGRVYSFGVSGSPTVAGLNDSPILTSFAGKNSAVISATAGYIDPATKNANCFGCEYKYIPFPYQDFSQKPEAAVARAIFESLSLK